MNTVNNIEQKLTFGLDPEVFAVKDVDGKKFCVPPVAFEQDFGVKPVFIDPTPPPKNHNVFIDGKYFKWHHDGAAFELGTKVPFSNVNQMFNVINGAKGQLIDLIKNYGLEYYERPVVNFDPKEYYEGRDERFKACVIFGCDEDIDAFSSNYVCKVIDATKHPYRYGGGHWHIGSKNPEDIELIHNNYKPMVSLMACTIGIICVANSSFPEEDKIRANTYGKPGRCRLQLWGIEYRSPSNSWFSNKLTAELMIEASRKCFYLLTHPKEGKEFLKRFKTDAIKIIRKFNQDDARALLGQVMG